MRSLHSSRSAFALFVALCGAVAWGRDAHAGEAEQPPDDTPWVARPAAPPRASGPPDGAKSEAPAALPEDDEKRGAQDYDGRSGVPADDGAGLWTARILLAPAWFVTEVLIRKPAEGVAWTADKVKLFGGVADKVTQDPEDAVGLTPIGVIELGNQPMVGAYVQMEHLMAPWERLRGVALFGGVDVMRAHLVEDMHWNGASHLELGVAGVRRDDLLTWGLGPRSRNAAEATYSVLSLDGIAKLHATLAPHDLARVEAWSSARRTRIGNGDCDDPVFDGRGAAATFYCGDPTVVERSRVGDPLPPGFGATSTLGTGARLVIDAPPPGGTTSAGGRLDLRAEERAVIAGPGSGSWVRWGGRGAAQVDITGHRRLLSLGVQIEGVEALGNGVEVPLLDLPGAQRLDDDLEGDLLLGVRPGRTVGASLAQAALDYRWPVWTGLDAQMQTGVGNAFGPHFEDFEPGLLRFAFAGGVIAQVRPDFAVRVLAGFATDTFDGAGDPATARVLVGATTPL